MNYKLPHSNLLGTPIDKTKPQIIIGAGISGLYLGYYLKKAKIPFKIIEQSNYGGGLLQSVQTDYGLTERAANGFIWCKEIQEISDDLGLEILAPRPTSKARYIVKNKQLRKIPLSFFDGIRLAQAFIKKHQQSFETLQDFGNYFLGEKIAKQVLEPAFTGIYGAPIDQLSFPGAMSKLAKAFNETSYLRPAFKKMRGKSTPEERKKRAAGTHCFKNGMGELTQRLTEYLKNEIEWNVDGRTLKDEKENLILTTPAYVSKDFFQNQSEILYQSLQAVRYNSMISVTAIFPKTAFSKFKKGFGCLIPKKEGLNILGVLFNSYIFDHRVKSDDLLSLTCILRDDTSDLSKVNQPDDWFKDLIIKDLDILFGINESPVEVTVSRWKNGIPLYSPTLYQNWFGMDKALKDEFPNRNLFGNYTGEISVRGLAQSSHNIFKYIK